MSYKIPLFDLNFDHQEEQAVIETIRSKWISLGPRCQEFEGNFASMLQIPFALSTSSCTAALHLALKGIDIRPGDEVIVPSFTFIATVNAISYLGAIPVFADIESVHDLTISISDIKKKITPKTRAIMVMHYAGFSCEMEEVMSLAKLHNIKVIEDASHAPFAEYNHEKLGTIGDIGCFSFFSNKNISTGEGGMLITKSESIYQRVKLLRSHGMTTLSYERAKGHATKYDVSEIGYNYRMDDIRASIGIIQLTKIKKDIFQRNQVRKMYLDALSTFRGIDIPFYGYKHLSSNYIMPILLKDADSDQRDKVRERMHELGIQTSMHYPPAHTFTSYSTHNSSLPVTDYVAKNEISLPMYSKLSKEDIELIAHTLNKVLKNV